MLPADVIQELPDALAGILHNRLGECGATQLGPLALPLLSNGGDPPDGSYADVRPARNGQGTLIGQAAFGCQACCQKVP